MQNFALRHNHMTFCLALRKAKWHETAGSETSTRSALERAEIQRRRSSVREKLRRGGAKMTSRHGCEKPWSATLRSEVVR